MKVFFSFNLLRFFTLKGKIQVALSFFFYSWIHLWEVCVCVGVLSFVTPMLLSDTWMKVLFRLCAAATTISETRARSLTGFPPNEHHQLFFFFSRSTSTTVKAGGGLWAASTFVKRGTYTITWLKTILSKYTPHTKGRGMLFVELHNGGFSKLEHPGKQWFFSQKVKLVNRNQPFLSTTNSLLVCTKHRALRAQRDRQ